MFEVTTFYDTYCINLDILLLFVFLGHFDLDRVRTKLSIHLRGIWSQNRVSRRSAVRRNIIIYIIILNV